MREREGRVECCVVVRGGDGWKRGEVLELREGVRFE
jgi:hypothetical protein